MKKLIIHHETRATYHPVVPDFKGQTTYFHGGRKGSIRIIDNGFQTFDIPRSMQNL